MLSKRILTLVFVVVFVTLLAGCFPSPIEENQAPIIISTPVTTAKVGIPYTYDVDATDPEGDILTYSLTTPAGMTINSATGVISWLPTFAQVGDNDVTVVVSDGDLSVVQNFTITVSKPTPTPVPTPVNHAPSITSTPSLTAIVGVGYTYTITATDPDGDVLTYSLVSGPAGMTFTAPATINWTPVSGQIGPNDVTVKASDGDKFDTQSFTVVVVENQPPTADAGPDRIVVMESLVEITFIGAGTDLDGTVVSYSWDFGDSGTGTGATVGNTYSAFGNYPVTLTVMDNGVATGSDTMLLKILSTIQAGIDAYNPVDLIEVMPGEYNEDVTIDKSLTLVSTEGKDNTIINGQLGGWQGAVSITANDVAFGGDDIGFTVNSVGQAAVYFSQPVSGCIVEGNDIVAASGKNALLTVGGQSNHTIQGNSFQGDASQLVYVNGQPSVSVASMSVDFIGNTFAGTATGPALGQEAADSTVSGNTFDTVTGYASLELWVNNTVTGNNFTADLPAGGVYVLDNTGFGPGIPGSGVFVVDIAAVLTNNTFLRAVTVEHNPLLPKIWANIQDAINEAVSGDTINVEAGTYNENLVINNPLTLEGEIKESTVIQKDENRLIQINSEDVTITGFSILGRLYDAGSVTSAIFFDGNSGLTVEDNIIESWYGVVLNGLPSGDATIKDNYIKSNMRGIVYQNSIGPTNLLIEGNTIECGDNPHSVAGGIYIQGLSNSIIRGNTIRDFPESICPSGRGICGSGNDHITIYDNTFENVRDAITLWVVTNIDIDENTITNSDRYGINIKGQNINIMNNKITGSGDSGVRIDEFSISTQNVNINFNNITGNTNYGVKNEWAGKVDAKANWWGDASGPSGMGPGTGDAISTFVDYIPWSTTPH